MSEISKEQALLSLKKRLFWSAFGLMGSLGAFTFAYQDFLIKIGRSGFLSFLSLGLSDFKMVSLNGADYVLSLAESLPAFSFALVGLTALFVFYTGFKLLRFAFQIKQLKI